MSMYRRKLMIANALKRSDGNINYPGLIAAWSAKGKTNDDADRAILKDLTGNGHDITLNGFAFSKMSGYGGYKITNFDIHDGLTINSYGYKKVNFSLILDSSVNYKNLITVFVSSPNSIMPSFKLKISGLKENQYIGVGFHNYGSNIAHGLGNGIHNIPSWTNNTTVTNNIYINDDTSPRQHRIYDNVTIELLPEYPDTLVFDGINDYGINEDMPKVNDYTLIIKRNILGGNGIVSAFGECNPKMGKTSYFWFEQVGLSRSISFGVVSKIDINSIPLISFQTKRSYNGITPINANDTIDIGNENRFMISSLYNYKISVNMAFYSAYLFNRSLTEQEIKSFIRKHIDPEYLLPSEIPTPDCYYDFSKGSNDDVNRNTIKDYSGNGNDAVAHNFAWNEDGSGYKDGALYFDGVDDYVSLDAFDSGFKTMFMVCNPFVLNKILYEQRHNATINNQFAIYLGEPTVAYNARNTKGITYINSVLNNKLLTRELINKKQCITVFNNSNLEKNIPLIGTNINHELNEKMALYKFLGFKEALTEEQIQTVIKKYNLLDGVDEIEVS